MIQNCGEPFVTHINKPKFVECIDEVLAFANTQPVVRERILDVLAGAVYKYRDRDDGRHGYAALWRKVRDGKPEKVNVEKSPGFSSQC